MPPLTVFGNPPRGGYRHQDVVASYRGVPIRYEGGWYFVAVSHPTKGKMYARFDTERKARAWITKAAKIGAKPIGRNPSYTVAQQLSRRVYGVEYKHVQDGKDYRHDFATGVCAELLSDGSIRIYSMTGKRLWKDFG